MNCGNCLKTDGRCYTSNPPKVKCTVTGNFHFYGDECDCDYITTNHTPDPNSRFMTIKPERPVLKTALEIEVEELTKKVNELEILLRNGLADLEKKTLGG